MGFEVFGMRRIPMKGAPSVTIQKSGVISINGPGHELFGSPEVVELLFDPGRSVIAIRAAEVSARSYGLRARTGSGQVQLVAKSFFDHYQIDHQVSRRFEPFIEESMLCVDLTGPSVEVHGNRTGTGTPPPGTTAKNSQDGLDDPATD